MFPECERSFLNPCPGAKHSQPRPPHRCRRLDSSRCAGEGRTAAKWQQCQDLGQEQGSGPAGSHPQAGAYSHPPNPRPAQLSPSGVSPPCVPQAVSGDLPSRFSGTLGAHEEDTNAPRPPPSSPQKDCPAPSESDHRTRRTKVWREPVLSCPSALAGRRGWPAASLRYSGRGPSSGLLALHAGEDPGPCFTFGSSQLPPPVAAEPRLNTSG